MTYIPTDVRRKNLKKLYDSEEVQTYKYSNGLSVLIEGDIEEVPELVKEVAENLNLEKAKESYDVFNDLTFLHYNRKG